MDRGGKPGKIRARGVDALQYGNEAIDMSRVEQIAEHGQAMTIGLIIKSVTNGLQLHTSLTLDELFNFMLTLEQDGLGSLTPFISGELALPRSHEVVAAINRMRNLILVE